LSATIIPNAAIDTTVLKWCSLCHRLRSAFASLDVGSSLLSWSFLTVGRIRRVVYGMTEARRPPAKSHAGPPPDAAARADDC
jgi:hypothetical protein